MTKVKLYIYGAIFLLILGLAAWGSITRQRLIKARAENIRYQYNQQQLLDEVNEYKRLVVTREEMLRSLTKEQDSLIQALKLKPKQIERIVERVHHEVDTTNRTELLASNDSLRKVIENNLYREYPFLDKEGCFIFAGTVGVSGGLRLNVDRREYLNRSTEIAYLQRSKKFLFIRYGPWIGKLYIDNECGADIVKELTISR